MSRVIFLIFPLLIYVEYLDTLYIGQQDTMEMINCCCFSIFVKDTFIVLIITKAKSPKFIGLED